MTDRKASVGGVSYRTRQQSPNPDPHSVLPLDRVDSELSVASLAFRRRSSRARSAADDASDYSSQLWIDDNKDDVHKAKGGRSAPRKATNVQSPVPSESSASDTGKDAGGFMPRFSRILEGKDSKTTRRKRGSAISSVEGHSLSRRVNRSVDGTALKNRPLRQSHSSLQRVEKNLASLKNPSFISVLSGLTQQSNTSNESNSTITQQSYDRKLIAKHKPTKGRRRPQAKRIPSTSDSATMTSLQPSVFQYMENTTGSVAFTGNDPRGSRSSSASSSSGSEHYDISPTAEEHVVESPPTSLASAPRPNTEDSHEDEGSDSDDIQEAPPGHTYQPSVSEATSESDEQDDEAGEEEDNQNDDEPKEGQHRNQPNASDQAPQPSYATRMALERVPPPRIPSASSSHHSDQHTRRLRRQEQALNEHILQNPQPQRDFHFTGAPSPHYTPTMPLYDPCIQTGPSPVSFTQTMHHAPPAAPPPPQTLGYYSPAHAPFAPYSSGYDNEFAVAARPPMAPTTVAQASQLQYSPMQPPHYQVHPSGPDLSKTTIAGYELLAGKLSKSPKDDQAGLGEEYVVPMYRKFENLNHRVLLHLQDEIAELEEELRSLDECIAQCAPRDHAGHHYPASRRGDARYGGEMHYRRTELLGRVYLKLGQYNSALTSFNTMVKTLDPASAEDIQAYRSWMEKRTPIDHTETRFLEHQNDLLTVSEGRSASIVGGVAPRQSGAIWLPLVLVLPLMVFAIVPGLLGRLVILGLIGVAIMKLITSTDELMRIMAPLEWTGCFSVYFGFMALLAALVR